MLSPAEAKKILCCEMLKAEQEVWTALAEPGAVVQGRKEYLNAMNDAADAFIAAAAAAREHIAERDPEARR